MLSPVNGEVVEVNAKVQDDPGIVNKDPYHSGWLVKVRTPHLRSDMRNLLSGMLARNWMRGSVDDIQTRLAGGASPIMADGGIPVTGFAREIEKENWDQFIRDTLVDYK